MSRLSPFSVALLGAALVFVAPAARAALLVTIDKSTQQMTVSVNGETIYRWPVSTGRPGYDTPSGSFRPFRLEEDHYSKEWDDAPMPHSIFFTQQGHAIHGTDHIRRLGTPASAGCVRLAREHAATLFDLVKSEGLNNVRIVVRGEVPPLVARRSERSDDARDAAPPRRLSRPEGHYAQPRAEAYYYYYYRYPNAAPYYGPPDGPFYVAPRYGYPAPPPFRPFPFLGN
jgi:hypothetical protein